MSSISDYEIFACVVHTGNMSAAGRQMGLSPAVVSKRISHLEKRLGSRLFQRTTRQISLTETGEGFYRRVIQILDGIKEAEAFVARRTSTVLGNLRITGPTIFSRLHIAPFLPEFMSLYPDLNIELNASDDFVDLISEGYDVAVRIGDLKDSSLVAKRLAPNHRILCAAPNYLEKHGEPASLADLSNHEKLSFAAHDTWRLAGPEGEVSVKADGAFTGNSSDIVRTALMCGLGISLRSLWDVGPELKAGKLRHVLKAYRGASGQSIYAVFPCRDFMPEKLRVFLTFFSEKYGNQPYWENGLDLSS